MKVLLVSQMYPRADFPMYGTFVRDKALALQELGVEVRVCVPLQSVPWPISSLKRYRTGKRDATFKDPLPTIRIRWLTFPRRFLETWLRRHAHRGLLKAKTTLFGGSEPDLIYANDLFPDGYACTQLSKLLNKPLVVTSHGGDNRVHVKHPGRRKAVLTAAEAATRTICVSDFVRRELIDQGLEATKLVTVHNGVDLDRTYTGPETQRIRDRFGNRTIILIVGHMVHFVKGFDITIQAFGKILQRDPQCDAVLVLVGDGVERGDLEKLVANLGLQKRVFFEGAKRPEETMQYMSAADIYCMPSWYEAFGIVYLEAMMHGKPVIGVQGQGISEVVEHGKTGMLVPPKDVAATCEVLDLLLRDERLRKQIGECGRCLVQTKYAQKHSAEQTLHVFQNVLTMPVASGVGA